MDDAELSAERLADLTPHLDETYASRSSAALAGDHAARLELIHTCRDYLLFIANHEFDGRLQAKCAPSDIVQNTLVKAVEHFDEFQGENQQALLAWLRRILIHEIVDSRRAFLAAGKRDIRRENPADGDPKLTAERLGVVDPDQTPATRAELTDDIDRLRVALQQLSPDYEAVIRMRNWERLTFAEIGRRMGRSEEAAKKLWARALTSLKDALADHD